MQLHFIEHLQDLTAKSNVMILMRERGKIVPGSVREGHNVFTTNGKNWLTKLMAWQAIAGTDVAYTNRRVRWMGLGSGAQLESPSVTQLVTPVLATATDYLRPIQSVEFPTSASVRFIKEFGTSEINVVGTPVLLTEAAMFADVSPSNNGAYEDVSYDPVGLPSASTLNPTVGTNSPITYKSFDGLSKTVDFTLEVRWDIRLG
jgi:hypothetical protein